MAGATNESSIIEVGLVLQGGGALGTYEWGAIEALFDLMDATETAGRKIDLRIVTGVSIGAINAACIVGSANRGDARTRLAALWNDFMIKAPAFVPGAIIENFALYEVPNFYKFFPDLSWTHFYQTTELLDTLSRRVNFAELNNSETAFVVTAVDVNTGALTWFANRPVGDIARMTIAPKHVLASGSLPPQFPWTPIGEGSDIHYYWDGGLIDNTPLGAAIDGFTNDAGATRILVVMNLFPERANLPKSYVQVDDRINQLRFGNRLSQDASNAKRINELLAIIENLVRYAPPDQQAAPLALLDRLKRVQTVEVKLSQDGAYAEPAAFRDFSQQGIERRRTRGYDAARAALTQYFPATLAA
ncbi:MAG TPA: patatin-like phospholipase family protein [Xanthobacteraceae bacterium]